MIQINEYYIIYLYMGICSNIKPKLKQENISLIPFKYTFF